MEHGELVSGTVRDTIIYAGATYYLKELKHHVNDLAMVYEKAPTSPDELEHR